MVDRVERMIEVAGEAGARFPDKEIHESVEFLQWLTDDNFIYLGYREYEIVGEGDDGRAEGGARLGAGNHVRSRSVRYSSGIHLSEMTEALRGSDARRPVGGDLQDQPRDHHPPAQRGWTTSGCAGYRRTARWSASCG